MMLVVIVCSLWLGIATGQPVPDAPQSLVLVSGLKDNINPFGIELYNKLCANKENCVFSPYSLYVLTSMLASGAGGDTFKELLALMNQEQPFFEKSRGFLSEVISTLNTELEGYKMSSVNGLYTDEDDFVIKNTYKQTIQSIYQGVIQQVTLKTDPEAARTKINNDISTATNDLIKDLLPPGSISELTEMVLTNAIYFKANWLLPFKQESTASADFKLSPTETIQVPMMFVDGEFRYKKLNEAFLLELPYVTRFPSNWAQDSATIDLELQEWDVSMVLILPEENISLDDLDMSTYIMESQQMISTSKALFQTPVNVFLPKFEIEFDAGSMKSVFTSLGASSAFNPVSADFSGISNYTGLYVSDIFHKAKIIVNEEGTEAAAAAAAFLNFESMILPEVIRFERPFGFMLIYKPIASVLFMGKVGNPAPAAK